MTKKNGTPDRLRQLAVAFRKISLTTPELKVDPPAVRKLPSGPAEERPMFRVRLSSASGEGQARMYVYDRGAKLESRAAGSGDGERRRSAVDDLPIDLRKAYRWDTATFPGAGEMAEVMYKHMTRHLQAATGEAS